MIGIKPPSLQKIWRFSFDRFRGRNFIKKQSMIQLVELVITEIKKMETEGKKISVSELSRNTGLSKALFYKNEEVRSVLAT